MICLVDLPFSSIYRPPIGLALLRSSLLRSGFDCEIRYANMEFAAVIGKRAYHTIADKLPHDFLIGDYIFRQNGGNTAFRSRPSYADGGPGRFGEVPDWVWDMLPCLEMEAKTFIQRIAEWVANQNPLFLGLTATFQLAPSLQLAAAVKALSPHIPVVLGGGHCDSEMGVAIHEQFPQVDFVCRGEGEELIVALARALSSNDSSALREITGLVWRADGASVPVASRASNIRELDTLPVPDYDDWLAAIEALPLDIKKSELSMPVETSRGCWYGERVHCTFCGLNGPSLAFRSKSPSRVLNEIQALLECGVHSIDATDLIMDHTYFDRVLPALSELDVEMSLFYEVKSNLKKGQVSQLARAGVRNIQPGIESLSTSVLKLMRKGVSAYQNIRLLKWCMESGVTPEWNILYGFPFEDPHEYARMSKMVPLLFHLRPPTIGCNRVLMNRFSPLHFDSVRLGARNVRPVPAYESTYGFTPETSSQFAYYFDFDFEDHRNPETYIGPLKDAIREWQSLVGAAMLTRVSTGDEIRIFDTRPCATAGAYRLSGAEARVYNAMDGGLARASVPTSADVDPETADRIVDNLLQANLILDIDNRLLALAVSMDAWVPPDVPDGLVEPICLLTAARLAKNAWESSDAHASLGELTGSTVARS